MSLQTPSQQIKWEQRKFKLVVIAENIHSPSNAGMIMRICEAFGVQTLNFSGPYSNNSTDRFKRAARSSEKYIDIETSEDTVSLIQAYKAQNFKIIGLEIANDSKDLSVFRIDSKEKVALLIGSERHGVSAISLNLVDEAVHINQFGRTGSLNVGSALSIALYEISKQIKKNENE